MPSRMDCSLLDGHYNQSEEIVNIVIQIHICYGVCRGGNVHTTQKISFIVALIGDI